MRQAKKQDKKLREFVVKTIASTSEEFSLSLIEYAQKIRDYERKRIMDIILDFVPFDEMREEIDELKDKIYDEE